MFYQPEYEARIFKALQDRAILLTKCKEDAKLRACVYEKCKDDPAYFIETFLFTAKNTVFFSEKVPNDVPFLLFDFQKDVLDEMIDCITTGKNLFIEKSRQMGITWLIMAVFLWGFLFKGWRVHIISQKEEYVDKLGDIQSCFERLRYFLRMTPDFLLPKGFQKEVSGPNVKFRAIVAPDGISSITGESANPNAGTGGTYTCIFMDEMAKQDHAKSINTACAAATQCRIFNSTPYGGEGTEYYSMRKLAMQKKIKGVSLLWSLNPFYTKEWYEWKTNGMTEEQIQQELEINYTVSVIGRVYPKFQNVPTGDVHIGAFPYDHTLPLYVALDNSHGGPDPHAVVVAQKDDFGRIRVIDSCQSNLNIREMAHFLAKKPLPGQLDEKLLKFYERWEKYKSAIFVADPHDTMAKWNDSSIYEEYRKAGIYLTRPSISGTKDILGEQIRQTTMALKRLDVNQSTCEDFISAIQNSKYPDKAENSQSTAEQRKPIHNWCLVGETKVRTTNGWVRIDSIKPGDVVWGYSTKESRLIPSVVSWSGKTKEKAEIIEIGIDNGKHIRCTPDHLFMLRNGNYVRADELSPGTPLMPFYERNNRGYLSVDLNDETWTNEHRFVYNRFHGTIPQGEHIDHIDGDHYNNNPDNLQKMTAADHCSKSFKGMMNDSRKRIDITDYSREIYGRESTYRFCPHCGVEFYGNHKMDYCSKSCQRSAHDKRHSRTNRILRNPEVVEMLRKTGRAHEERSKHKCHMCDKMVFRRATYCKSCLHKVKNHKVRYIKKIQELCDVYDITVPETSNFVAEGVVVHNCSHYRTALEYLVLYLNQMDDSDPQGFSKESYVEVGDPITGEKTMKRIAL